MKFLSEVPFFDSESLKTSVIIHERKNDVTGEITKEKKYFVEGIFAQAETRNRNNRIYPKKVLSEAVTEYQKQIAFKRSLGELNHPNHPNVNPERASHICEYLQWQGNDVVGRARVLLSLPMGKIVKGLIDEGVSFGVSTRGLGSVKESDDGRSKFTIVEQGFVLNAIDIVSDPSGVDCWVNGVLESREWVYDLTTNSWIMSEELDKIQKKLRALKRKQVEEQKMQLFKRFLSSIT